MKKVRHLAEYLGMLAGIWIARACPSGLSRLVALAFSDAWFALDARRRGVALSNIMLSGIAADERAAKGIARASFRHFGVLAVESLKGYSLINRDNWRDFVDVQIDPSARRILEDPAAGMILVSGHLGNWELAGRVLSMFKPVVAIARVMNNPMVEQMMDLRTRGSGFSVTPKHHDDAGRLLSILKDGNILAILADQYARSGGMMVDFFGQPASTHTSPAMLHLVTRAPLCFGYCLRTGPMRYRMKICEPIVYRSTGNRDADKRAILEMLGSMLEAAIREAPGQYLWAHRRWR